MFKLMWQLNKKGINRGKQITLCEVIKKVINKCLFDADKIMKVFFLSMHFEVHLNVHITHNKTQMSVKVLVSMPLEQREMLILQTVSAPISPVSTFDI